MYCFDFILKLKLESPVPVFYNVMCPKCIYTLDYALDYAYAIMHTLDRKSHFKSSTPVDKFKQEKILKINGGFKFC